ncbi:NAD(P)/FAD-dependent oxidoreductase [Gluconobacter wancherniae]|uniref:NADH dehydrogenase n=1 Tax=Gluconobacter wancherniae NBRC 103581 TaxID=656744 RepID=A0A511AWF6_9PROT|nr:NAD(P)/FAD-dependent oxidoreductase [Gluconobacter wancherniae]MBF0852727.1 NAD(P)/FAD-dependent oxidoreductase [Gluconobacter wancherniae]MBS1061929.1 NAD(P)/FAD-dependent oxidoreductase [Gluconobacter wancherniae]MBS1087614.1 NAD(P)/FAD-dependent oxidoreductase [Gluconobacter wancherniae]MBS1093297.1 NAD(P)/FAD-dependent oxidoreductase [Gluconobacter wancherniae]GBD56559.1 NADH dehydrogenase [Gluconobacter wancherniae NBRC 103581]
MSAATRVIVLGGGVGGLEVATTLARRQNISLTLVDRSPVHFWKPSLHEFAAGTMAHANNCIPFTETASKFGFTFAQTVPTAIDREARTVTLENGTTLPYDYLVAALGSRANDFGIPGVVDNCLFIDSLKDADALFATFREAVQTARAAGKKLSLGIVGGGATGVQLVAELCKSIDDAPGFGPAARKQLLDAVLIETGPRILPAFPEAVSEQASRQLEALGVHVRTGCMVVGADETGFNLKTGEHIPSTLRVWAAGVKASDATSLFGELERGRAGQLAVTETLQTTNDPRILAIGDCSRIDAAPVAPTAQAARQQGQYVGKILPQLVSGQTPSPFVYHDRGAVVALGDYNGWGMLDAKRSFGGGGLTGLGARLIHEGLYRQHQAGIIGLGRTICTTLKEHFSPVKPDLRS